MEGAIRTNRTAAQCLMNYGSSAARPASYSKPDNSTRAGRRDNNTDEPTNSA
jgi:hypothetical protein